MTVQAFSQPGPKWSPAHRPLLSPLRRDVPFRALLEDSGPGFLSALWIVPYRHFEAPLGPYRERDIG